MSPIFRAVIEATEEAIYNSMFVARTVDGFRGRIEALPVERILEILRESSATDLDVALWMEQTITRLNNWDRGLMHLLGSLSKGMAVLEIRDDGPGMSPEFLSERLHHPFQSTKKTGYGIGLFQCRMLAEQLGGILEIESEPGCGTTARLSLPLLEAERTAEETRVGGGR